MFKLKIKTKKEMGFTLIELIVVAAIISILLSIAVPNLLKARISSNEASARKALQTLRDAEGEYQVQDLDNANGQDYTTQIGNDTTDMSLRCPDTAVNCVVNPDEALIDDSFEGADASQATGSSLCDRPKAGYCFWFDDTVADLESDFGWKATMTSAHKNGRKDFAVYGDGSIRCKPSAETPGDPGAFEADRASDGCN